MDKEIKWETVLQAPATSGYGQYTKRTTVRRLAVPTGWLYETLTYDSHRTDLAGPPGRIVTFVPAPVVAP